MNGLANSFTGNRPKRICIVDDDEMLSMMLEDHLAKNPSYFIETFPTGEDFLTVLEEDGIPDMIILDFNLAFWIWTSSSGLSGCTCVM